MNLHVTLAAKLFCIAAAPVIIPYAFFARLIDELRHGFYCACLEAVGEIRALRRILRQAETDAE